ncbi:MAG: hypothetical protein AAF518_09350, partial [Spirochaetota bacterium]
MERIYRIFFFPMYICAIPLFILYFVSIQELPHVLSIGKVVFLFIAFASFYFFLLGYIIFQYCYTCIKEDIVCIFILSFVGYFLFMNGPFLMPPSDPLFHLNYMWQGTYNLKYLFIAKQKLNSIFFYLLFWIRNPDSFFSAFELVQMYHLCIVYYLICSAYFASRVINLPPFWSVLSVLIMLLFFGTNRFSYVSYYSLTPSAINMGLYWLFSALLFSSLWRVKEFVWRDLKIMINITILIVLLTPIVYNSHAQESGFLFFTLLFTFYILLYKVRNFELSLSMQLLVSIIFLSTTAVLFFPYLKIFHSIVNVYRLIQASGFLNNYGTHWLLLDWKVPRIWDTLGIFGVFPWMLVIFYPLSHFLLQKRHFLYRNLKLSLCLSLVPIWMLLVPFNLFVWASSITNIAHVLWRATYSSQFWISISFFLYFLSKTIVPRLCRSISYKQLEYLILILSFCFFYLISEIRSSPFWGKKDFIILETYNYYKDITRLISTRLPYSRNRMYWSDPIT